MNVPSDDRPDWLDDPGVVLFAGEPALQVGDIEEHGIGEWAGRFFTRSKDEVRADWDKVMSQLGFLLERTAVLDNDFQLDEVTFSLGFSAEGQVVFVAKAGIQTTISAKFSRRQSAPPASRSN